LHSYLWALDRHRANDPARAFDNLAQLAEKHRCCILLVRPLRKRVQGVASIELSAAFRKAPSRLPPRATASAWSPCAAPNATRAFLAPKIASTAPGTGPCPQDQHPSDQQPVQTRRHLRTLRRAGKIKI
jgi:hypothetical protein